MSETGNPASHGHEAPSSQSADESIVAPEQRMIDPHHHIWDAGIMGAAYHFEDFLNDTRSGHAVNKSVYVECGSYYRPDGPEHLRPVGETERIAEIAQQDKAHDDDCEIAAIISFANLLQESHLSETLDHHEAAGQGLFRGIRHAGPHDPDLGGPIASTPCPYADETFRNSVRSLGARGLTYDTWHFYHQNDAFLELAKAAPDTTLILDHCGCPLGVKAYADKQDQVYDDWRASTERLAACPNVRVKLGGLAMPFTGLNWPDPTRPPTSEDVATRHGKYYRHLIDCFGADRCMFESNFPVDKASVTYAVLWNGMKKVAASYSDQDRDALFYRTAMETYRL